VRVYTPAWIAALGEAGERASADAVKELTADGLVVLCDVIRLELWNGASGAAEVKLLRDLERELESVPTTDQVWEKARDLARACRAKGVTVPASDLLVAACAEEHRLELLHHDAHFDRIAKVSARAR
jgi:predicted nucleic acid-binding protein